MTLTQLLEGRHGVMYGVRLTPKVYMSIKAEVVLCVATLFLQHRKKTPNVLCDQITQNINGEYRFVII